MVIWSAMRLHPIRRRSVLVPLLGLVLLAACSGDPVASGESLIEDEIEAQIGLGELEAACEDPSSEEVGSTFGCTATTPAGDVIDFTVEFDSEDEIFVFPTNVVAAEELVLIEEEAAQVLSPEVGATIDPSDVDCGEVSIVLDDDGVMSCVITDSANGDRYELEATFTNHERGTGFFNRDYLIVGLLDG